MPQPQGQVKIVEMVEMERWAISINSTLTASMQSYMIIIEPAERPSRSCSSPFLTGLYQFLSCLVVYLPGALPRSVRPTDRFSRLRFSSK
jgi:hypothetical protein